MNADGTNQQPVTNDSHFNVDAELSPNGQVAAFGSYRGPGHPSSVPNSIDVTQIKTDPWNLVTLDLQTRGLRVLTEGQACADIASPVHADAGLRGRTELDARRERDRVRLGAFAAHDLYLRDEGRRHRRAVRAVE